MATDPVQRVRQQEHDTPLALSLKRVIGPLGDLPPSTDAPYLTVSLDWRPEGTNPARRQAVDQFEKETEELLQRFGPRGKAFDSISADIERIKNYLDKELDPSAQGVVIVACNAAGVFKPLAFGLPVPTHIDVGPTPSLSTVIRLLDDSPTFGVLVTDQHDATLHLFTRANRGASVWLESTDYPRKQQQGGFSQRRFQARADERVSAFAQQVAEETQRALEEVDAPMLIIAGDEVMTSALDEQFHESVKDRIAGTVRLDVRASESDILEATLPIAEKAERQRELEGLRELRDRLGANGGAVASPEDVLTALQAGQVMTLFMNDDFDSPGWADYSMPLYGVGDPPSEHPAGGDMDNLVPISLKEEIVRLIIQTGAEIDIIPTEYETAAEDLEEVPDAGQGRPRSEASEILDGVGGIAAVLRFSLDEDQATADL